MQANDEKFFGVKILPPTHHVNGEYSPNATGWFNSDVSVILIADDSAARSSDASHITCRLWSLSLDIIRRFPYYCTRS